MCEYASSIGRPYCYLYVYLNRTLCDVCVYNTLMFMPTQHTNSRFKFILFIWPRIYDMAKWCVSRFVDLWSSKIC